MDATKILIGSISILIGVIMLPVVAWFNYQASHDINSTGQWVADTDVTNISGLTQLTNLVVYGFAFGLVGIGVGMIYMGFKK